MLWADDVVMMHGQSIYALLRSSVGGKIASYSRQLRSVPQVPVRGFSLLNEYLNS